MPKIQIVAYCHKYDFRSGLDGRMIAIESAFESSDTILINQKKFNDVRTHLEELHAMKSEFYLKAYKFNRIFYFSWRVVL